MNIWLDTIDRDVIAEGARAGIISGVTTNPSILAKTQDVRATLQQLLDIQPGPVAVQVTSQDVEHIVEEAHAIFGFSNRCVVKIPITYNGLAAIERLKNDEIPILGTAIVSTNQALLASQHHLAYIAPYFSHMGDNALGALKTMISLLRGSGSNTKVLVASLKQLDHVMGCALLGVNAITIKAPLYHQLMARPSCVESCLHRFSSDWMQMHGTLSIKETLQSNTH